MRPASTFSTIQLSNPRDYSIFKVREGENSLRNSNPSLVWNGRAKNKGIFEKILKKFL